MKKAVLVLLITLLFTGICYSQAQIAYSIGDTNEIHGRYVIHSTDGNYVFVGSIDFPTLDNQDMEKNESVQ